MSFLKPPKTDYTDHYDITRFNLVWNLCIVLVILLTLVSVVNATNENYTSITNVIEVIIGLIAVFTLAKTRKYRLVGIFTTITSFLLVSSAFFFITNALHYTTPMWGIANVLFAFFVLGRFWGLAILIGHFTVVLFYLLFRIQSNIENLPVFESKDIANFIIEMCIIGLAMGYLLMKFIKANRHAETSVRQSNDELKLQNEVITAQNKEKEVMLKEIHHRVKNNLQVITSLLRLQAHELQNEADSNAFTEAINRVKSMALIHEKMYQSDRLANFDLKNYLESLTADLIQTYSVSKPIELNIESTVTSIESKSIVPISLLFNELISNSIKHGFDNVEKGIITVEVKPNERTEYFHLNYSDNGSWKNDAKTSFGMELIDTMTDQLEGEFELVKNEASTAYSFVLRAMTN